MAPDSLKNPGPPVYSDAPDLADDVFIRGLDVIMSSQAPSPDALQTLAKFLFTAPNLADKPEEDQPSKNVKAGGVTVAFFQFGGA